MEKMLSVVVSVYNEEQALPIFYQTAKPVSPQRIRVFHKEGRRTAVRQALRPSVLTESQNLRSPAILPLFMLSATVAALP